MIRAVLDTNVLVSGFVRRHASAPSSQILNAWREATFELVTCDEIIEEVERTLRKPYFAARLSEQQITRATFLLRRHSFVTALTSDVRGVATHPEDDAVLDAAVSAGASILVTGDGGLQSLGSFRDVEIQSPRDFLQTLGEATR